MQITKRFLLIITSSLLFISSFLWFGNNEAEAAYVYLEYQLPDPVGDSIRINSKDQYSTVANWIKNKPSNHTGWSAVLFRYNAEATTIYDGKETNWWPVAPDGKYSTQDGFEGVTYPVSMFKDKIIAEHGQEMYDRLVAIGLRFDVKSGQSVKDYQEYNHDSRTQFSNPKTGDLGFLYYENNVTVYLEYYYDGSTPTDPTEPGVEEPEPEPDPDSNIPPIAIIDTLYPSYKMGDRVIYYGSDSYDPDAEPDAQGNIENNGIRGYTWQVDKTAITEDEDRGEEGRTYSLYYMKEGYFDMGLRVRDSDGATDETNHTVQITPPTIEAKILASGTLKENRHVILESEIDTPEKFPLIPEKTVWTIKPLDGQEDSICVREIEDCQQIQTITGVQKLDVLFKKDETYEISLHVENTAGYTYDTKKVYTPDGYSDPYLFIAEDELPKANFATVQTTYRDIDNNNMATIKLTDKSVSNDDMIAKRIWSIRFDSDNDEDFSDEGEPTVIDSSNKTYLEYDVGHVGKYEIFLETVEEFAQPTLEEFVTPEDRKRDDTSDILIEKRIVNVDNLAPVVGYDITKKRIVDLNIAVGESTTGDINAIESKINEILAPRLNKEGVKLNLHLENAKLKKDEQDRQLLTEVFDNAGRLGAELYIYHDDVNIYLEATFYPDSAFGDRGLQPSYFDWGRYTTVNGAKVDFNSNFAKNIGRGSTNGFSEIFTTTIVLAPIRHKNIEVDFDEFRFVAYRGSGSGGYINERKYEVPIYTATADDYIGKNLLTEYSDINLQRSDDAHRYPQSVSVGYTTSRGYENATSFINDNIFSRVGSVSNLVTVKYNPWITIPNEVYGYMSLSGAYGGVTRFYSNYGLVDVTPLFRGNLQMRDNAKFTFRVNPVDLGRSLFASVYDDRDDPEYEVVYLDSTITDPVKMNLIQGGDYTFFAAVEDNEIGNYGLNYIKNTLSKAPYFVGLGTNTNKTQFESLINGNQNKGTFINNTNLDTSIDQLGDYILEVLNLKQPINNEIYITLDEEINYKTTYLDAENDPKFAEKWKYDHNPDVFENNQGQIEDNMVYQEKPITKFTKVGRYQPYFTAQDDPLERFAEMGLDPSKFEEYRKWAKDADNWYIYVHRKPVAYFEPYMLNTTGQITIYDKSYDLDKQSLSERGIKEKRWSYRKVGATDWTVGKPTVLDKTSAWEIRQIVTDYQGASAEYIARVNAVTKLPNTPPIAKIVVKSIHYIGDEILVTNESSDPDGDVLTYTYQVTNPIGQIETINQSDSRIDSNGNLSIVADTHPTDLGNWTFTLTVSDGTETASATASTMVLDQTIQGQVAHTEQWLRNIEKYNIEYPSKSINLDPSVGLVEFLPGERFVLNSSENTENRLVSVESYITESSRNVDYKTLFGTVDLSRKDEQLHAGTLWHESMIERFHDGEVLTFEFVGTFENGWIDTETVQVRIKDDLYWRQHTAY